MASLADVLAEKQEPEQSGRDRERSLVEGQHGRGDEQRPGDDGVANSRITAAGRLNGVGSDDEVTALELAEDGVEAGRSPRENGQ